MRSIKFSARGASFMASPHAEPWQDHRRAHADSQCPLGPASLLGLNPLFSPIETLRPHVCAPFADYFHPKGTSNNDDFVVGDFAAVA
jgi:hypothetical protein